MMQTNTAVTLARIPAGKATHSKGGFSKLSPLTIRRVVAALKDGHSEARIASEQAVTEAQVREIRRLEFRRIEGQVVAFGPAMESFIGTVKHLHSEIDRDAFDELLEGAA